MAKNSEFDVIVAGGGPAGMMAAGRAAELGARVALLEKNGALGRKLLLTGNGRCNMTNSGYDLRKLVERYGKNGKFLYHALSVFGVSDTVGFFNKRGLGTKVEENGRVFPATDRAADVLAVLMGYLKKGGVKVMTNAAVDGFEAKEGRVAGVKVAGGVLRARSFILCTGGKSYPKTGSSGEAFGWLRPLGHSVTPLAPALVPVTVKEGWVREMEGASLRNVGIAVIQSGRKRAYFRGEAVVTASGLSGPVALDMSGNVRELMSGGEVTLRLDFKPDVNLDELDRELLRLSTENPNKLAKNFMTGIVAPKLAGAFLRISGIDGDRRLNGVSREERKKLAGVIKGLPMTVKGLGGFERAMVTKGGVSLNEIDPYTMRSKLLDNLYFAGEVIDVDGPTGGYNLQACWSTGYLAGGSAAKG